MLDRVPDPQLALGKALDRALALLHRPRLSGRSVHEIRREIKRARAALRLLREAAGKEAYARENAALRDAGRRLSAVRDARVVQETLERLAKRGSGSLRKRHALLLREAGEQRAALERALLESRKRSARWRLPRPAWPVLSRGLERIYRNGRKALREAEARASDRALHEARKQVKHLGAAIGILEPLHARRVRKLVEQAAALAETLGDDHDLALLYRTAGGGALDPALRAKLQRRRGKLQKKALKRAQQLYERKPAAFIARLDPGTR